MTNRLDLALEAVMAAAELSLPMDARTYQTYLRTRSDQLCTALEQMIEELPADHLQEIKSRWQYAQVLSSMWQLHAYAAGQPLTLQYVDSTFDAADRRARALCDLTYDIAPPARLAPAEPVLISDAVETLLKEMANGDEAEG